MVQFKILGGGYDVFVATYLFNNATSTLTLQSKSPTGNNPSWLSLNPTNRSQLYVTNEITQGALQSFSIDAKGALSKPVETVSSGGDSPAFATALSTGEVAVFNYNTGNGRILATTVSPQNFDKSAPVITFQKAPGTTESHPHEVVEYQGELFVPDLGQDTIWRLKKTSKTSGYAVTGSIPQPKGSGPRHISFYNDRLFTLHELASTLSVQSIPAAPNGNSTVFASVSIIPPNPPSGSKWQAAEILIPPTSDKFPTPYIYVSNRNTGSGQSTNPGDTIAIYEHVNKGRSNEGLVLIKQVPTGLQQVRGMVFGNPEDGGDEYLVAGGVTGTGGVAIFQRVDGGKDLKFVTRNYDVPTRISFVWL